MEPALKDKIAIFQGLKFIENIDDKDDEIDEKEQSRRNKFKAFHTGNRLAKNSQSFPISSSGNGLQHDASHRRTNSESTSKAKNDEDGIIKGTPQPSKRGGETASSTEVTTVIEGTPVPDTTKGIKAKRKSTRSSVLQERSSRSSAVEETPIVKMGKRKREQSLKMVPEDQRWFKDLRFYYIPNDDTHPLRKVRITKAREHGAEWTRDLAMATHVIVNNNLKYEDIDKILKATPDERIIVNEEYPIQCIHYGAILNPNQKKYQVPGTVNVPIASTGNKAPPKDPDNSLEIKSKQNNPLRRNYVLPASTPPRSQDSSQISSGLRRSQRLASTVGSQEHQEAPAELGSAVNKQASHQLPNDELSECIEMVNEKFRDILVDDDDDDKEPPSTADADDIDEEGSSEEERIKKRRRLARTTGKKDINWQDRFRCMKGGTEDGNAENPNARTIEVLENMLDYYTSTNDHWRIMAYRKAISVLREQKAKISTYEEAIALPSVGNRLALKIQEIVYTNRLRRLEYAKDDPMTDALELFLKIYDVGLATANKWIAQGFRTLDDLKTKAKLSQNQQVGIEHYDDLNTRIPRREVEALGNHVKRVAATIDANVDLIIGGSYRRGADSSGDIDFIVTRPGTSTNDDLVPFLGRLVQKLSDEGFLTVELASLSHSVRKGNGSKWHGCCVLPERDFPGPREEYRPIWRRVDFLLVPQTEFGASLLYFTGNDIFNRSMRLLASKKGMRLNQRGLYKDIMRGPGRTKISEGELVEGRDEKRIFEILGVTWREPHDRWC